jgi:hypothetical protein
MARLIVVSDRVAIPSRDGANYAGGLAVAVRSLASSVTSIAIRLHSLTLSRYLSVRPPITLQTNELGPLFL